MTLKSGSLVIGIVGKNRGEDSFGAGNHYLDYFGRIGVPMILPPMTTQDFSEVVKTLDVVVLPGGGDLLTTRYGEIPSTLSGEADQMLEYFDQLNLGIALNSNALVVGICRGFQSLVVHHGYALTQHLWSHPHSEGWYDTVHELQVVKFGRPTTRKVNSLHHQGLVLTNRELTAWQNETNIGMRALAWFQASVGGPVVIEAIEGPNFLGVQWHPEALDDTEVLEWIKYKVQTKKMLTI